MMNLMWWGILVGMLAVGLIDRVPRQFVIGVTLINEIERRRLPAVADYCETGST